MNGLVKVPMQFFILLVGALFIAIGLFCSALTKSQVVAAVSAAAILFVVTVVPHIAAGQATRVAGADGAPVPDEPAIVAVARDLIPDGRLASVERIAVYLRSPLAQKPWVRVGNRQVLAEE